MSDCTAKLKEKLLAYDGRAISMLGEAEAALAGDGGYIDAMIALCGDEADEESHVSNGATWLLKSALEKGRGLTDDQARVLCDNIPGITDWQAQLHICQSFRFLEIAEGQAAALAAWLASLLTHDRPFLRAWSLDALCRLAMQHRRYGEQARKALAAADQDPAASVRARARNIRKELDG